MVEDLLSRIQREMQERMEALRPVVAEQDRLQAELRVLEDDLKTRRDSEPLIDSEPPVEPGPLGNLVRLPVRRELPRKRVVSPKVARLMLTPRRPALERSGIARVNARADSSSKERVDELDPEAERYEHSI